MANHDRDFIDEQDLEAYQFLFNLSDADKLLLAKFAEFSGIEAWEKWLKEELKGKLPAYNLLDKIHLDYICDGYDWNPPFEPIDLERMQQIANEVEKEHQGIVNMLEVNTLALIESLRQSEPA